ncbi:MAG: FkbM family methyltransferase [Planctomycetales bacterium]|nr:FkbM family methyltransferase [Planctomycetales bacterium]MCA9224727.1 FkbM family methyltransferase [Planctomycetales bacterium]
MSEFSRVLKREGRKLVSLSQAVRTKCMAFLGKRGPSRTCQVPGLRHIVATHLATTATGTFVEVGAYDGERFSNTSWLADNGWRGVYVEPSSEFSRLCRLRHCLNRVQVINVAAGEADGHAMLKQIGSLSTLSDETFDEYQRIPWARGQIEKKLEHHGITIRRLDSILESLECSVGFELLVVDVEGFEESVFRGFDLERWQPRMLIVELCDVHEDFSANTELVQSAQRVRAHISNSGYTEVYRDAINTVFVRCQSGYPSNMGDLTNGSDDTSHERQKAA